MKYRYDLLQWRRKRTGDKYEAIAEAAGLSVNAAWKTINGKTDPSATTLKKIFCAMGLDPKHALNDELQESQFRRAVVATAR